MRSEKNLDYVFKFHLTKNLPLSQLPNNEDKEYQIKDKIVFPRIIPDIFNISAFNKKFRETRFNKVSFSDKFFNSYFSFDTKKIFKKRNKSKKIPEVVVDERKSGTRDILLKDMVNLLEIKPGIKKMLHAPSL